MNASHTFPLVEVSGTAYNMGYQHGRQAGDLIRQYLRWIEKETGMPRQQLCRNAQVFLPYIQALNPAYIEEIRGLADGADLSFDEALLCQARGEAAYKNDDACSAFALTGEATVDGAPLAGQNQDLPPEYADVAVLLHVKPSDGRPRALIFTFAGQMGYSGMNQHGLALFANGLYDYKWQPGLPKYPLKRAVLEQETVGMAVEVLKTHPVCSANNIVLADGQGSVGDVEIRPEGAAVFADRHPHCCVHTNHHLTDNFTQYETFSLPDSRHRLARMNHLVSEQWGHITVDSMKEILADHEDDPAAICRHGANGMHSISGYIAEPARGRLHVRRGHGCIGSWTSYEV